MKDVVVGPHFDGDVLWPKPRFPTPVYAYLPKRASRLPTVFDPADFDLVAWAEIYESRADAGEASADS